jgi:site-specific DNA recombinase
LREDARGKEGETQDRPFDVVVIYAFDRLARKQVHQAVIVEDLRQKGISIESVTEDFDESAIGQFMRNAAAFAAELEHEKIRERTQRGLMAKWQKGYLSGSGQATYGYKWNEGNYGYIINEEEAKTVRLIFDLCINHGYSSHKIAVYLQEQGIPNRVQSRRDNSNLLWSKTTVHRILRNQYYTGEGKTRKRITKKIAGKNHILGFRPEEEQAQIAEGIIPPIIDKETFTRAQEKLDVNKVLAQRNNINPEESLLRAGYAKCGVCGETLRVLHLAAQPKKSSERFLYQCYDRFSSKRCNKKINITCRFLDDAAWDYIKTLIADKQKVELRLQEIEAKLTQIDIDFSPIDNQIAAIDQDMRNCTLGIVKAKDEYTIDLLTTESEKLANARRDLEKLRAEMSEKAGNVELIQSKLDRFRDKWFKKAAQINDNPTYQDKREACEILGIQATVYQVGHKPRYSFTIVPPEIVSLNPLYLCPIVVRR